jgi:hypothetical protein
MNIPQTPLDNAQNILIVGLGGGFDVFTGLPFVFHWRDKNFILTNHSSSQAFVFQPSTDKDYPEGLLSNLSNVSAKYTIGRHGPKLVKSALDQILQDHQIDVILGVDGGVDSLSRGDEEDYGTVLEDFVTLAALSDIKIPKVICCAGFGCETEENMNFYRILENMSELASTEAFYGSFSLTNKMIEFQQYVTECELSWGEDRRKSHIQTKIISAAIGKFGPNNHYSNVDPRIENSTGHSFISLLSNIFWMFDLDAVIKNNLTIEMLKKGNTFTDAKMLLRQFMITQKLRSHESLPL